MTHACLLQGRCSCFCNNFSHRTPEIRLAGFTWCVLKYEEYLSVFWVEMSNQGQIRANYKVHFSGYCHFNFYVNVVLVMLFLYLSKGTLALWLHSSALCSSLSSPLPFQPSTESSLCLVLLICSFSQFLQI